MKRRGLLQIQDVVAGEIDMFPTKWREVRKAFGGCRAIVKIVDFASGKHFAVLKSRTGIKVWHLNRGQFTAPPL
jgi:hypothetical protein